MAKRRKSLKSELHSLDIDTQSLQQQQKTILATAQTTSAILISVCIVFNFPFIAWRDRYQTTLLMNEIVLRCLNVACLAESIFFLFFFLSVWYQFDSIYCCFLTDDSGKVLFILHAHHIMLKKYLCKCHKCRKKNMKSIQVISGRRSLIANVCTFISTRIFLFRFSFIYYFLFELC